MYFYKYFLPVFFLLLVKQSDAQGNKPRQMEAFIPKGYFLLKTAKGNLNADKIEDVVLVVGKSNEDSLSSPENPLKRKLFILTGCGNNLYKLAAQNENAVYYYKYDANFTESLVDIRTIKNGFIIDHYGGFARRWGRSTTFKYNSYRKKWVVFEDEYTTFDATDADKILTEKTTTAKDFGLLFFEKFNIYKNWK